MTLRELIKGLGKKKERMAPQLSFYLIGFLLLIGSINATDSGIINPISKYAL